MTEKENEGERQQKDPPKPAKDEKKEDEKSKAKQPSKPKYPDWPLKNVKEPHANDVLYGRGGGTNHHPGNKRYRKMVEDRKTDYINSKRLDKPLVALDIIRQWRAQEPPGRFLKMDEKSGLWNDVGDKKAREKTSQALREKAPEIRRAQEEKEARARGEVIDKDGTKNTRFAKGTNTSNKPNNPNKAILARDHSLGREYLQADEAVTLEGFSWRDGTPGMDGRSISGGSMGPVGPMGGPSYPPGRVTSMGSMGTGPPQGPYGSRTPSQSSMYGPPPPHPGHGPPPPGDPYGFRNLSGMSLDDRQRSFSSQGRYESWGSAMIGGPSNPSSRMPSMGSIGSMGSLGSMGPPPPMPYSGGGPFRSGGSTYGTNRENSMSRGNPLRDATISMPADPSYFGDGYWSGGPGAPPPPPPPPGPNGLYQSGGSNHQPPAASPYHTPPPPGPYGGQPNPARSPSYEVDPKIAQTWSAQSDDYEKVANLIEKDLNGGWVPGNQNQSNGGFPRSQQGGPTGLGMVEVGGGGGEPTSSDMPKRPDMVKRMTSNQNEDESTRRDLHGGSIKRAALNRDSSAVANALKEKYIPAVLKPAPIKKREVSVQEMGELKDTFDQTSLGKSGLGGSLPPKPSTVGTADRTSTIDQIAMEIYASQKPAPLNSGERTSTAEIITKEFVDDGSNNVGDIAQAMAPMKSSLPRPPVVRTEGRMTTEEYGDLMNEPLAPMGRRDQAGTKV